ncbi:hypothetical protein Y032_0001g133 [Ancylostoma ceylanicum]|uniref:Uncharacterized protein n=1 Tax=Ancylostoma ceylanicum TaxID=53326 RepID=A0A016W3I6_9BILA|nr:hypothetical protein Y032_0001g133 [Ancylostoma ceylanicum]
MTRAGDRYSAGCLLERCQQYATRHDMRCARRPPQNPISVDELLGLTEALNVTSEASTATLLKSLITLHCAVVSHEKTGSALEEQREADLTWTERCNSFSVEGNISELALWPSAILGTFKGYGEKADWFLFVTRNTFVIPENARLFLLPFLNDKDKAIVFGSETDYGALPCLLMSRGALNRLKSGLEQNPSCGLGSDMTPNPILRCLSEFGIAVWETRDQLRRHRILPIPPSTGLQDLNSALVANYSLSSLLHPIMPGPQCCAPTAFAILLLSHNYYRMFHYFINIVHTTGTEIDYRVLSNEAKLSRAWYEATKGIPPTFMLE